METVDLRSLTYTELEALMLSAGEKQFRTAQVFSWLHEKTVDSIDAMTNLSKAFRKKLETLACIRRVEILEKYISQKDGTIKYLMRLEDGECVETVVMVYHHGTTVCVSSQVGCRMGCRFCASTIGGKTRDLLAGEILGQLYSAQQDIGKRISNLVMMGIGEPLDNFENVRKFLLLVGDARGQNMGYRHISLSTCGLTEGIAKLAELNLPITLSVSLHAPNDAIRSAMMPVNRKHSIAELMQACRAYQRVTGRRISFEYAMCDGVNDRAQDAVELAALLSGMLCHVNLIPVNSVKERKYRKSKKETIESFIGILASHGITATVRRELGSDISASCGQLRRKRIDG